MTAIDLDVPTVHCQACKLNIEETLDELTGVIDSHVDLDAKQVHVDYDPGTVDAATITTTIRDAGYPVG